MLCPCGTDDGSGTLDFSDFVLVMGEKSREADIETHFKDTFRVFSKDEDGKRPALGTPKKNCKKFVPRTPTESSARTRTVRDVL